MMIKLTAENYFSAEAQRQYMSYSQFKEFSECEFKAMAILNGEYKTKTTDALLIGSYVDAHFEENLRLFKAQNPGYKRIKERAEKVINRVEKDELMMKYMSGQKQVIMTGSIEGVPVKIKIDSYHPGKAIVDFKTIKDFKPVFVEEKGVVSWIEAWMYDMQAAVYQEIVYQNTGRRLPYFIAAVTKEEVPDIDLISLPQSLLDTNLTIFKADVPRFQLIKEGRIAPIRCEKCEPCKYTKKLDHITKYEELINSD